MTGDISRISPKDMYISWISNLVVQVWKPSILYLDPSKLNSNIGATPSTVTVPCLTRQKRKKSSEMKSTIGSTDITLALTLFQVSVS